MKTNAQTHEVIISFQEVEVGKGKSVRKSVRDVLLNLGYAIQIANEYDIDRREYIPRRRQEKVEYMMIIFNCYSTSAPAVAIVKNVLKKAGYRPVKIGKEEASDE